MAVYQVSQVATYIKDVLYNDPVLTDIWVEGEVANLSRPPSGHTYFSLSEGRSTSVSYTHLTLPTKRIV